MIEVRVWELLGFAGGGVGGGGRWVAGGVARWPRAGSERGRRGGLPEIGEEEEGGREEPRWKTGFTRRAILM
jgi:hypothetical protein